MAASAQGFLTYIDADGNRVRVAGSGTRSFGASNIYSPGSFQPNLLALVNGTASLCRSRSSLVTLCKVQGATSREISWRGPTRTVGGGFSARVSAPDAPSKKTRLSDA